MKLPLFSLAFVMAIGPGVAFAQAGAIPAAPAHCAQQDFADFIAAFTFTPNVQAEFTANPLLISSLNMEADPEPVMEDMAYPHSELTWPMMPPLESLTEDNMVLEFATEAAGKASVIARGLEDGRYITWEFTLEPCWKLTKLVDQST